VGRGNVGAIVSADRLSKVVGEWGRCTINRDYQTGINSLSHSEENKHKERPYVTEHPILDEFCFKVLGGDERLLSLQSV